MGKYINLRSPYHIFTEDTDKKFVQLGLFVYKGEQILDRPSEASYVLSSILYDGKGSLEISELVRDFITNSFDGTYNTEGVWVDYSYGFLDDLGEVLVPNDYESFYSLEGYTYFEEGINSLTEQSLLSDIRKFQIPEGNLINIPIYIDNTSSVTFKDSTGDIVSEYDITLLVGSNSDDKVTYISEEIESISDISSVVISGISGIDTYVIERIEECRYDPIKLTYINRYGVLEDVWFYKKSSLELKVKREDYKKNLLDIVNDGYSTTSHQNRVLNINGDESLSMNTGYLPESYNEVFRQIMFSNQVWVTNKGLGGTNIVRPVNIETSSFKYKTILEDSLINYEIKVKYSFNTINNIR